MLKHAAQIVKTRDFRIVLCPCHSVKRAWLKGCFLRMLQLNTSLDLTVNQKLISKCSTTAYLISHANEDVYIELPKAKPHKMSCLILRVRKRMENGHNEQNYKLTNIINEPQGKHII